MSKKQPNFNQRIKKARQDAHMTLLDVVIEVRLRMPEPMWVSQSKLHRLEESTPEAKADPFLVNVLANIYGKRTSEISEVAANDLDTLRDLLEHASRWITARDEPDQMILAGIR